MISYAVTVCNEILESKVLIRHILEYKQPEDELVVLFDVANGSKQLLLEIKEITLEHQFQIFEIDFNFDFSVLKNTLNSYCNKEYIFNIDADEVPLEPLIKNAHQIIKSNPDVEAFWVPRVNLVNGITFEHVKKWGWKIGKIEEFKRTKKISKDEYFLLKTYDLIINEFGEEVEFYIPIINPFEYQLRLYKNSPNIKWVNKVHEKLTGYKSQAFLPKTLDYSLYHPKSIYKQEKQNDLYDKIIRNGDIT